MGNKQTSPPLRKQLNKQKTTSHLNVDGSWNPIPDQYHSLEEVQQGLRRAGLESCNLIFGIDLTSSNTAQGKRTYQGKSLHSLSSSSENPYEKCLNIISRVLNPFDDDDLIPLYGFGCSRTNDHSVLDIGTCNGLSETLARYRALIPTVKLAGPTSFGPLIRKAVDVVVEDNNSYHILIIIADGEITRPSSLGPNEVSQFESDTIDAIIEASQHPLSIVMIGVGDGPWDQMIHFDDRLPERKFDNFQFVSFDSVQQEVRRENASMLGEELDARFALHALMEIPEQYEAILRLHLMRSQQRPDRGPQQTVALEINLEQAVAAAAAAAAAAAMTVPVIASASATASEVPFAPFPVAASDAAGQHEDIDNLPVAHNVTLLE